MTVSFRGVHVLNILQYNHKYKHIIVFVPNFAHFNVIWFCPWRLMFVSP